MSNLWDSKEQYLDAQDYVTKDVYLDRMLKRGAPPTREEFLAEEVLEAYPFLRDEILRGESIPSVFEESYPALKSVAMGGELLPSWTKEELDLIRTVAYELSKGYKPGELSALDKIQGIASLKTAAHLRVRSSNFYLVYEYLKIPSFLSVWREASAISNDYGKALLPDGKGGLLKTGLLNDPEWNRKFSQLQLVTQEEQKQVMLKAADLIDDELEGEFAGILYGQEDIVSKTEKLFTGLRAFRRLGFLTYDRESGLDIYPTRSEQVYPWPAALRSMAGEMGAEQKAERDLKALQTKAQKRINELEAAEKKAAASNGKAEDNGKNPNKDTPGRIRRAVNAVASVFSRLFGWGQADGADSPAPEIKKEDPAYVDSESSSEEYVFPAKPQPDVKKEQGTGVNPLAPDAPPDQPPNIVLAYDASDDSDFDSTDESYQSFDDQKVIGQRPTFEERFKESAILVIGASYHPQENERWNQVDPNYIALGARWEDVTLPSSDEPLPFSGENPLSGNWDVDKNVLDRLAGLSERLQHKFYAIFFDTGTWSYWSDAFLKGLRLWQLALKILAPNGKIFFPVFGMGTYEKNLVTIPTSKFDGMNLFFRYVGKANVGPIYTAADNEYERSMAYVFVPLTNEQYKEEQEKRAVRKQEPEKGFPAYPMVPQNYMSTIPPKKQKPESLYPMVLPAPALTVPPKKEKAVVEQEDLFTPLANATSPRLEYDDAYQMIEDEYQNAIDNLFRNYTKLWYGGAMEYLYNRAIERGSDSVWLKAGAGAMGGQPASTVPIAKALKKLPTTNAETIVEAFIFGTVPRDDGFVVTRVPVAKGRVLETYKLAWELIKNSFSLEDMKKAVAAYRRKSDGFSALLGDPIEHPVWYTIAAFFLLDRMGDGIIDQKMRSDDQRTISSIINFRFFLTTLLHEPVTSAHKAAVTWALKNSQGNLPGWAQNDKFPYLKIVLALRTHDREMKNIPTDISSEIERFVGAFPRLTRASASNQMEQAAKAVVESVQETLKSGFNPAMLWALDV